MKYKIKQNESVFKDIKERQSAYQEVFGTDVGKMVLEDLLSFSAVDRSAFNQENKEQTFLNLGKQLMGYHLQRILTIELIEEDNGR